jgi:amino acid transporter
VITSQGPNILFYFANHAVGSWAGYVMIFAVLSSTVGTTQTTLLPAARITYSMARDKVFPQVFGSIQGKTRTPAVGTLILAFVCMLGILIVSRSPNSYNYLQGIMITSIGVLIGFYYGVTGITCAWAYRKVAFENLRFFVTGVLMPLLAGIVLLLVGGKVFWTQWTNPGDNQSWSEIITLGLGIVLVIVARVVSKSAFFTTKATAYETIE